MIKILIAKSSFIAIPISKPGAYDLKKRGVRMRWITEITRENIPYCMEATNFAEFRRLDGIRASGCL
jgi:hypothetical protein